MISSSIFKEALLLLEDIIGVTEAAELLKLSPGDLREMCENGRIDGKKVDDTWVFNRNNLDVRRKRGELALFYGSILVGELFTRDNMPVSDVLALIGFDEAEFLAEHGWDTLDYNEFRIEF